LNVTVSDGVADPVPGIFRVNIINKNEQISITNKDLVITVGDRTPANTTIGTIEWDDVDGVANN